MLNTLQTQYIMFYTDLGNAYKTGGVTRDQYQDMIRAGYPWRETLQTANQMFKQYESTHDEQVKVQIIGLVAKAEQIAFELAAKYQSKEVKP